MELLTADLFYGSILRSVGCTIHPESGYVHVNDGSDVHPPLTINQHQVVLPTPAALRKGLTANQIGFAPAGESVIRRESLVMKKLRELITSRITYVTIQVLEGLMDIAADHSKHPLLTPDQSEFLSIVPEVNETTVQELSSVLDKVDNKGDNRLIQIYIKSNGKHKGEVFKRLASVSFPIMEAREQEGHKIFGVKMRKANKKAVLDLLEWVFPNCGVAGAWNYGSHDMAAPSFQALLLTYESIINRLNEIVDLFDGLLTGPVPLWSETNWQEGVGDIARWRSAIPTLPGNDGEIIRDSASGQTPTVDAVPPQAIHQPTVAPVSQSKPAEVKVQANGLMPIARPLSESKFNRPAAAVQQGFTVVEPPPTAPVTYAAPQVQGRVQPAMMTWEQKQEQLRLQQAQQYPPPPNAYPNSGYNILNAGYQTAPAYNTPVYNAPVPYNPPQPAYNTAPPPVPAHLAHVQVSFDQMGQPYDQMGQPIPPEIMVQLGYRVEQVPVQGAYNTGYPPPPSQQLPPGRAQGLATLAAKQQAQQYAAYNQPPRYR